MMRLYRIGIAISILVLAVGCEPLPTQADRTGSSICAGDRVPDGYVVTSTASSNECPAHNQLTSPNAFEIKALDDSPITICVILPFPGGYFIQNPPAGYVVVSATNSHECPAFGSGNRSQNSLTIRKPESPMTICARWPVPNGWRLYSLPSGYVIASTGSSFACPDRDGSPNAYTISTLTSPMSLCSVLPHPAGYFTQHPAAGYVVVSAITSSQCPSFGPGNRSENTLTISTPTSPMDICGIL